MVPYATFPGLAKQAWKALEGFNERLSELRKIEPQLEGLISRYEALVAESHSHLERVAHLELNQQSLDVSRTLQQLLTDINRYNSEFDALVLLQSRFQEKNVVQKAMGAMTTSKKVAASKDRTLRSDLLVRYSENEVTTTESLAKLHADVNEGHQRIESTARNNDHRLLDILSEINQFGKEVSRELQSIRANMEDDESEVENTFSTIFAYAVVCWLCYVCVIRPLLPSSLRAKLSFCREGLGAVKMTLSESTAYYTIWLFILCTVFALPVVMYDFVLEHAHGDAYDILGIVLTCSFFSWILYFIVKKIWSWSACKPDFVLNYLRGSFS